MEKNNFNKFVQIILDYLSSDIQSSDKMFSNLHETSLDDSNKNCMVYVYEGKKDLTVLDMDYIAKVEYKNKKGAEDKDSIINTADAFVISNDNQWFFIEFKNTKMSDVSKSLKDNIIKKAYSNWYMLLDIIFSMNDFGEKYDGFNYSNPIDFAKNNVTYIVVCKSCKNPTAYNLIKGCKLRGEKYTPPFMLRLKDYLFKDAYLYTEEFLEREFVECFKY